MVSCLGRRTYRYGRGHRWHRKAGTRQPRVDVGASRRYYGGIGRAMGLLVEMFIQNVRRPSLGRSALLWTAGIGIVALFIGASSLVRFEAFNQQALWSQVDGGLDQTQVASVVLSHHPARAIQREMGAQLVVADSDIGGVGVGCWGGHWGQFSRGGWGGASRR